MKMSMEGEVKISRVHQEDAGKGMPGAQKGHWGRLGSLEGLVGAHERYISGGAHCRCSGASKSLAERI